MGVLVNVLNVDENGNLKEWMPAIPLSIRCEKGNCQNNNCKDYKRKKEDLDNGWEDEPISLCDKHSQGYEQYN